MSEKLFFDMGEPDSLRIGLSLIASAVFLAVVVIGSIFFYFGVVSQELNVKERTGSVAALAELRAYETEKLGVLKWIDKRGGPIQIPVDLAVDLVVGEYGGK